MLPTEPLQPGHPLLDIPIAILAPHVAGYSEAAIEDLHMTAARISQALAAGEASPDRVNLLR